ncbi:glutathione-disulfide reductase [Phormidesmis priestleyi]|uniref:glutathione-disulfide reductase n=1 Tax=Phormidesmis priestleyi TaxID=268141 RepID=UPI00083A5C84|nr:glutathione-disulfide reductase [Phormidesmis priestleyi]
MIYDYDLFVIGAGPGGLAAAKQAAHYGARVAIAEANHLGGTCANMGCIPKKLMVYAADFGHLAEASKGYGWSGEQPHFSWTKFVKARDQAIERFRQSHERSLTKLGIRLIRDRAQFIDAHTLEVGEQKITADHILIAVGGHASKPDIPGIEHAVTSKEMFHLPQLPKKIAIIGGGYIGVEFASALHAFGTDVFLMSHEHCILNGFDPAISTAIHKGFTDRGIQVACNTTAEEIIQTDRGLQLILSGDSADITVDLVLCAIGRTPNLENLGLEQVGVEIDQRAIAVDAHSRTSQPNIFAVGDCTDRKQLTPVALSEGRAFADTTFGDYAWTVDYDSVPSAICCRPEAASVGVTEPEAQTQLGDAVRCYQSEFQPLFHSLSGQNEKALIKLIVNGEDDRVIGIHIVGDHAAEILQGFALAMKQGITKQELDRAIGIHPSSGEELFSIR